MLTLTALAKLPARILLAVLVAVVGVVVHVVTLAVDAAFGTTSHLAQTVDDFLNNLYNEIVALKDAVHGAAKDVLTPPTK